MKILVDKMPENPRDCVFNTGVGDNLCVINNRTPCKSTKDCTFCSEIESLQLCIERCVDPMGKVIERIPVKTNIK